MNCPIPETMDGQLLESWITADYLKNHPIQYTADTVESRPDENDAWDEEAEAEVMDRLKKLGYLG
jgi:hypothetical protein